MRRRSDQKCKNWQRAISLWWARMAPHGRELIDPKFTHLFKLWMIWMNREWKHEKARENGARNGVRMSELWPRECDHGLATATVWPRPWPGEKCPKWAETAHDRAKDRGMTVADLKNSFSTISANTFLVDKWGTSCGKVVHFSPRVLAYMRAINTPLKPHSLHLSLIERPHF